MGRNKTLVLKLQLLLSCLIVVCHGAAGPIEKHHHHGTAIRPPDMNGNIVPAAVENGYVFGGENAPDQGPDDNDYLMNRRDAVCDSEANSGCYKRCLTLKQNCVCGSNGKTYRNQCEMSCMRKVEMSTISWTHFGECKSRCPSDRQMKYKKMVKDLLLTRYLRQKVRRCGKLANCAQAKLVLEYTEGMDSITQCPDHITSFFLFTDMKCTDYAAMQLQKVLNDEAVMDCNLASLVDKKLFNDRNCARQRKGPSDEELVIWAFDELDIDDDWKLSSKEISAISSILPEGMCQEAFFSGCDSDGDRYVRADEWAVCLGRPGCYKPCHVYSLERRSNDRKRRLVTSVVTCNEDGTCAPKQCEYNHRDHLQCWCVTSECKEIAGTRSYSTITCS